MLSVGRRSFARAVMLVAVGLFSFISAPSVARSQDQAPQITAAEAAVAGARLETERKWRDAIDHYKHSLENFPKDENLKYGLRRAQFQFGIDRRYSDQSFLTQLRPMSREAALAAFDEILGHIRAHFVDPIDTTSVVAHGTESLWLALRNERFVEQNLFGAEQPRIDSFREMLRDRYWNKPVSSDSDARRLINEVCDLGRKQLGLEAGPIVQEYVFGACNCLDDYSNVLTPGRLNDLYSNIEGEFVGIGIVMEAELGKGMKLVQVLPESPAYEKGLRAGDTIVAIDSRDCRFMTTDEAAGLLTGKANSQVRLEVTGPAGRREASVTRREVQVKSIPVAKIIDSQNGVGYIQMTGFQKSSAHELDEALKKLEREGMKALIWDVRGNPGGLLTAAVEVLDRFIDNGTLVETRGRTYDQNYTYTAHEPGTHNVPIILLIDGSSASASEIVAGAIRDHHRGKLVGRKSYGKWSVQSIYDLRTGGGVRLTTAKFYSPNGDTLGKIGVKPDVDVTVPKGFQRTIGEVDPSNDFDVAKALEMFRSDNVLTRR
jgi:carboxyl-terminal processing protease